MIRWIKNKLTADEALPKEEAISFAFDKNNKEGNQFINTMRWQSYQQIHKHLVDQRDSVHCDVSQKVLSTIKKYPVKRNLMRLPLFWVGAAASVSLLISLAIFMPTDWELEPMTSELAHFDEIDEEIADYLIAHTEGVSNTGANWIDFGS